MTGVDAIGRNLLLLCHRIPYPPDKGDKIRSFRWMTALAARYRVYLAAFVDDADDWQHAPRLREICNEVCLVPLQARRAKLRSLPALLTGSPMTLTYYRDARMAAWIADLMQRQRIDRIVVYSSAMAQYVPRSRIADIRRIIDFVDVDADKWRQYAERTRAPMAWVYRREARLLLAHDVEVARAFDVSLFVSQVEVDCFRSLAGLDQELGAKPVADAASDQMPDQMRAQVKGRIPALEHIANGVDHAFFAPEASRPSPYQTDRPTIVFTGAMDYWANVDAVRWFVEQVWPRLRSWEPRALLYVVGSRPAAEVKALACDNVVVTGRVPDVRPYLQYAAAVIAPMQIARGIQNKVLEAMAMARPVVLTSLGLEGIEAMHGQSVLVADDGEEFAGRVFEILQGRHAAMGTEARQVVLQRYAWSRATDRFLALVDGAGPDSVPD
jgi:glycosyltransferase involved in cell wall biosynthesis